MDTKRTLLSAIIIAALTMGTFGTASAAGPLGPVQYTEAVAYQHNPASGTTSQLAGNDAGPIQYMEQLAYQQPATAEGPHQVAGVAGPVHYMQGLTRQEKADHVKGPQVTPAEPQYYPGGVKYVPAN